MSAWGLSDAGMWALTIVIVAGVAALCSGVAYVVSLHQSGQARAVQEATRMLGARLIQVEAARAQMVILCNTARDHVAVLESFRAGFQLFASDVEIEEARKLYQVAQQAAAESGERAAQSAARHGVESPTTAVPTVRRNGR